MKAGARLYTRWNYKTILGFFVTGGGEVYVHFALLESSDRKQFLSRI